VALQLLDLVQLVEADNHVVAVVQTQLSAAAAAVAVN
jgi:hypothetical protein